MRFPERRGHKLLPGVLAIVLAVVLFQFARMPSPSAADRSGVAAGYDFVRLPIAMPAGYRPTRTVREVNPAYRHLRSWISSVGAAVALTDLWGRGRSDGMCLVDPRTDQVVVTYAPTAPAVDRFAPFVLDPRPLPMDASIAPMGCTPGDFDGDGRTDLLVTYWGRTPVLFLARSTAQTPAAAAYRPVEVVPTASPDGQYHGRRWNTNAVAVADFDRDGHPDLLICNYFPDSAVLDPNGQPDVQMNSSMSNATNGGGAHVLRWVGAHSGPEPDVSFVEQPGAVPLDAATGWTLAVAGADLTGDGRPEVYIANDFGRDHLLDNRSTPGRIRFTEALGRRGPATPKSFVLGRSSFKGMGVDFVDLDDSGRFDMLVSNITTSWGLEESNFAWINKASRPAEMASLLDRGIAPFEQEARQRGLAWTGWGWDVKAGDFLNSGSTDIVQAEGFVLGTVNRWPWLQEMAMNNDDVYSNPAMWPDVRPGDDIAGHQPFAFYAKGRDGRYVDISRELGMDRQVPSRGVAISDTTGSGVLDFAVARQWAAPEFYANRSPGVGNTIELRLYRPAPGSSGGLRAPGTPAYGAVATVTLPDGRREISQLDGGSGHSGRRGWELHFGLGSVAGPVAVELTWVDLTGGVHRQQLRLAPGTHGFLLDAVAREVSGS